jgi:hypothetical protein
MKEYRFIYDGRMYSFPSEKQARTEAFRLTGKIGSVEIYGYIPSITTKQKHIATLVRWGIVLLVVSLAMLVWDAKTTVDTVFILAAFIYSAWPVLVILILGYLITVVAEKLHLKRTRDN